jgi:TonB-linked SusC/RagA family outer membrane protein
MEKKFSIITLKNRYNNWFVLYEKFTGKIAGSKINSDSSSMAFNINKQSFNRMNEYLKPGDKILYTLLLTVFFIVGICSVNAQDTLLVKGKVINGAGDPISNVAVAVEGSFELPVVTDEAGVFAVKILTGKEWLNIAPSGDYKNKRVFLNNRTDLTVYLTKNDMASGDDQVVVLSQTRLKRNMVASFSSLNTDAIIHTPELSVDQYLQGRVPGMHVVNRSGAPGSGAFSILRGISSLNSSNQPLYIVDGIPVTSMDVLASNLDGYSYNPLLGVNPLDISKAVVVKDPVLTAAYGSKASNGLVIIETLNPSATQTVIEFDLRSGYSLSPSNLIPQMDAGQHKTLASEVLFSSGEREEIIREEYPNLFLEKSDDNFINYQHNTNWQKLIFNNAAFSNINIMVKGGDEIARYGLSFGYTNADGIIKTTGYDGYNLRFVSLLNVFTWLKMNAGVSLSYNSSDLKESAKVPQTNPILTSLGKSPMLNPFQYDDDGNELKTLAPVDELGMSNPQAVIDNYEASNNNFNFTSTLGFNAIFAEYFEMDSKFSLTYNILEEQIFMPNLGMELYYDKEAHNVAKLTNNSLTSFYNNTYLKFNKTFGTEHHFTSNTGANLLMNDFELDWGLTKNAPKNDQYRLLQDGINNLREIGGANRNWNWLSFYEHLTYSYRDKYLVSATLSLDGSSRIGDNAKNTLNVGGVPFGLFYSGGLAWRLSHEPFLKNASWFEELKLRLTYGHSGNDDIGESNAVNYYQAIKFRETVGLYPALVPNDELTYETVDQINIGLDFSLLGNRLTGNVDLFTSKTNDMFILKSLESYFGYEYQAVNSGKMQNKGIEIGAFLRMVDRPEFKWDINASWSGIQNEIIEIEGDKLVRGIEGAEIANIAGETANSFYGYIYKGVYSTSAEAQNAGLVNDRLFPYTGGDAIFADISGPDGTPDNVINDYDKTVIGSSFPDHFGGMSNTFAYNRWSLTAFVQFVIGNEIFNYVRYQNESMDGLENQNSHLLNRWQYEGHQTDVPRALWNDPVGNSSFSTRWIEDGSYFRIKNISLSYTIPDEFLTFRNAQFYLTANNVFTFSRYLGYDPEFGYSHNQLDQGIDYGLTPQPRQFILGIKLGL